MYPVNRSLSGDSTMVAVRFWVGTRFWYAKLRFFSKCYKKPKGAGMTRPPPAKAADSDFDSINPVIVNKFDRFEC
jgi:hypothetical protein